MQKTISIDPNNQEDLKYYDDCIKKGMLPTDIKIEFNEQKLKELDNFLNVKEDLKDKIKNKINDLKHKRRKRLF